MKLDIITLDSEAFDQMIVELSEVIKAHLHEPEDTFISAEEAMTLLHIKSKTTLAEMRKKGLIRSTQVTDRIRLYDKGSIMEYLNARANPVRHGNI